MVALAELEVSLDVAEGVPDMYRLVVECPTDVTALIVTNTGMTPEEVMQAHARMAIGEHLQRCQRCNPGGKA